jgi:hypothetical protein
MHAIGSPLNESMTSIVTRTKQPTCSTAASEAAGIVDIRAIAMAAANFDGGLSRDHELTRATRSGSGESTRTIGDAVAGAVQVNVTGDTMLVRSHCTTGGKAVAAAFTEVEKANATAAANGATAADQENRPPNTRQSMPTSQASLTKNKNKPLTRAQQLTSTSDDESFLSTRSSFGGNSTTPRGAATPPPGMYRRLKRENDLLQQELKAAEAQVLSRHAPPTLADNK